MSTRASILGLLTLAALLTAVLVAFGAGLTSGGIALERRERRGALQQRDRGRVVVAIRRTAPGGREAAGICGSLAPTR